MWPQTYLQRGPLTLLLKLLTTEKDFFFYIKGSSIGCSTLTEHYTQLYKIKIETQNLIQHYNRSTVPDHQMLFVRAETNFFFFIFLAG